MKKLVKTLLVGLVLVSSISTFAKPVVELKDEEVAIQEKGSSTCGATSLINAELALGFNVDKSEEASNKLYEALRNYNSGSIENGLTLDSIRKYQNVHYDVFPQGFKMFMSKMKGITNVPRYISERVSKPNTVIQVLVKVTEFYGYNIEEVGFCGYHIVTITNYDEATDAFTILDSDPLVPEEAVTYRTTKELEKQLLIGDYEIINEYYL